MLVAWENICRMEKSRKNRGCRRILAEVEKSYQRYNNQAGFVEILGSPPGFQHIGSWYIYIYDLYILHYIHGASFDPRATKVIRGAVDTSIIHVL